MHTLAPPGFEVGRRSSSRSVRHPLPPARGSVSFLPTASCSCLLPLLRAPVVSNNLIRLLVILRRKDCQQFMCALALVERLDQPLHDRDRALVGTRIAPGFKIMRLRDNT